MLTAFINVTPLLSHQRETRFAISTPHRTSLRLRRTVRRCIQPVSSNLQASGAAPSDSASKLQKPLGSISVAVTRITDSFTTLFPVWTILCSVIALATPSSFSFITPPFITLSLSLLMLSTGLTLTPRELLSTLKRPLPLLFSLVGCYIFMPATALLLATLFRLPAADKAGLILLSIVSGGQMSNLCTLLAKGDVALSVAMTTLSTVLSAIALPLLSKFLLAVIIPVNVTALTNTVFRIVLLPVLLGCLLNALLPKLVARIKPALPVMGILSVCVLILSPVARTAAQVPHALTSMLLPVTCLHVVGGVLGFVMPSLWGWSRGTCVATSFETAFKSPALAYVLALKHFPAPVAMATVVSIVALAPGAALAAILLRGLKREQKVVEKEKEEITPFVPVVRGYKESVGNQRAFYIVIRKDGKRFNTTFEGLARTLARVKSSGGVLKVEKTFPN